MNAKTTKISVRLPSDIVDELTRLAGLRPNATLSSVLAELLRNATSSEHSLAFAKAYIVTAAADIAALLDLFKQGRSLDADRLSSIGAIFDMLLKMAISIEGVEP